MPRTGSCSWLRKHPQSTTGKMNKKMTNKDMSNEHTGGCYCGKVRYTTSGELPDIIVCHCTQCRRQSGHQYATTLTRHNQVVIFGDEHITWFNATQAARRGFCSQCGSHLFWLNNHGDLAIMAASIDEPSGLKVASHIFTADKGDYYEILDDLPHYERYPPPDLM